MERSFVLMAETTDADSSLATRDRLLRAARQAFAERGFAGTSIRSVVSAAGTGVAAVSHHFGSKRGLFAALRCELQQRLHDARKAGLDEAEAMGPCSVRTVLHAFFAPGFLWMSDSDEGRDWALLAWRATNQPELWDDEGPDARADVERLLAVLARASPAATDREIAEGVRATWVLADALRIDRLLPSVLRAVGVKTCDEDPRAVLEVFLDHACRFFEPRPPD